MWVLERSHAGQPVREQKVNPGPAGAGERKGGGWARVPAGLAGPVGPAGPRGGLGAPRGEKEASAGFRAGRFGDEAAETRGSGLRGLAPRGSPRWRRAVAGYVVENVSFLFEIQTEHKGLSNGDN